jgi:hypothetical protein
VLSAIRIYRLDVLRVMSVQTSASGLSTEGRSTTESAA